MQNNSCSHCGEESAVEIKIPGDFYSTLNFCATVNAESQLFDIAANADPEEDGFFIIDGYCSTECLELQMEFNYQMEKD